VRVENAGAEAVRIDLIHAQDVSLAPHGAIRMNEYYVSQYLDHVALAHAERGVAVAVRQNLAVGDRNPWAGARFCGGCGTPLASRCPHCGTESPPDARFCEACGASLTDGPAEHPAALRMRREPSAFEHDEVSTRSPHVREIRIRGEDRDRVRECVGRDEQVEGFDGSAPAPEEVTELSGLVPEMRRLRQLMAALKQREDPQTLGARTKAPPQLGDDGPAHRDLIGLEKLIDDVRQSPAASEEFDPGGRIDQDQRRVSSRSSWKRTFPRSALSADRFARRSISWRPSTMVGVMPFPVTRMAASSTSAGTLTVIFRRRDGIEAA
jgi:hypothetical protein